MTLPALGRQLVNAGLVPRTLEAWCGTTRLSAIARRRDELAARPITQASAALALFVTGRAVPRDALRLLDVDELMARGFVDVAPPEPDDVDLVRATVAILPVGRSLLVCDADSWPDDSSYHLAGALSGRVDRWLDLGCGAGFAPLARPELAAAITGVEIDERAVRHAELGCALSGIDHVRVHAGDLATATGRFERITCNAPIPGDPSPTSWRRADPGFFDRLWPTALACAADGATIVVHAAAEELARDLPGERTVVLYTPDGVPGFGVLRWRPHATANSRTIRRALTIDRPHVDAADLG